MTIETQRDKRYIEARCNRAIDAIIDIQDRGYDCDAIIRILELLNSLRNSLEIK